MFILFIVNIWFIGFGETVVKVNLVEFKVPFPKSFENEFQWNWQIIFLTNNNLHLILKQLEKTMYMLFNVYEM